MVRKSIVLTSLFVLAALALASSGGLVVSAWDATIPSNACTSGPCTTASISTPNDCTSSSPCTFSLGTKVYDSITIYDPSEPNGVYNGCSSNGFGSGNQPCAITGSVTFKLFSVPNGFVCPENGNAPSGTGISQVGSTQTYNFPTTEPVQYPPVVVTTPTGYDPSSTGHYVSYVTYTGNYKNGGSISSCEYLVFTTPSGVPEFPLGALGMFALIGMMIPLLFVMRSRFARKLSL